MKIHIITLFPESFESYMNSSILWRAKEQNLFELYLYKLSNFSTKNFGHSDDKAYGMHGQVISPEPLSKAIEHVFKKVGKQIPVLYMSPSGTLLNQVWVEKYHETLDEYIILCGHYEWIDQRIIEYYNVECISIWEYVLSSGELAAMVFIDSVVRHIPNVLWNEESLQEDSFSIKLGRQKEYPVYTRPEKFLWLEVPPVLRSGDHKKIEKWKQDNLR